MTDCFAIFEGGGAKGLAHVGALKAAEEVGLNFVGVAGASAGSIIAALVAAGFHADELYNPAPGTRSLLGDLDWIHTLGRDDWRDFCAARTQALGIFPQRGSPGVGTCLRARKFMKTWSPRIDTLAARRGFFSTQGFEQWLDGVLRDRLRLRRRSVTFDDLAAHTNIALKLVSVEIDAQKLVTYSVVDTPDMEVAKAVAASISIPFFFAPTQVLGRAMVDGGLMSNFPAWLFEAERADCPPFTRTYGFTLVEADRGRQPEGTFRILLNYAGNVIRTGIFGGQALRNESVEIFQVVPITTSFGVIDFELNTGQKNDLYAEGYDSAWDFFHDQGVTDDAAVTVALKTLADDLQAMLGSTARVRANVMLPVRQEFLRVMYTYNMQNDTDDRLLLRQTQTGAGQAFVRRQTILTDLRTILGAQVIPGLNKYDSALVKRDLVSLISVPVFSTDDAWTMEVARRPRPRGILNFDCNEDILATFNRIDVQRFVVQASIALGRLIRGDVA